ncbi:stress responsive A/B barrel domain-containing protein [Xylariaceae sp. FL0662B]|nr:stress responsive A/B barrel domain-containing protein [Xylariaceae sp. FL0662B]
MAGPIHRITMFKLPDLEGQQKLIEAYKVLAREQKKDGKPYIISLTAGQVMDDQRAQGWTVVTGIEFANLDDMRYYDDQCEAHAALKSKAKTFGIVGGPSGVLVAYFKPSIAI